MRMITTRSFSFPAPDKLMNLNDRQHWASRARQTRTWRTAAYFHALAAISHKHIVPAGPRRMLISIDLPVRRAGRRDAHNYAPTIKAIIDGMVDAGLFIDDSTNYVLTNDPTFSIGNTVTVSWTEIGL